LIDTIVPEPPGGAQEDWDQAAESLRQQLRKSLDELTPLTAKQLVDQRYDKFRQMGNFFAEAV
jgi:acetyl-CoA carboxylase carboxyl transferase subunit alpha